MDCTITLYCGPMKSGKSTACLIKYMKMQEVFEVKTILYSSSIAGRDKVVSRAGLQEECKQISSLTDEIDYVVANAIKHVFVDECQFFAIDDVENFVTEMRRNNISVSFYGLNTDFKRDLWPTIAKLLTIVDYYEELRAICTKCKRETRFQSRVSGGGEIVEIDGIAEYEPRCILHFL